VTKLLIIVALATALAKFSSAASEPPLLIDSQPAPTAIDAQK
jgi:hypothetical protein